MQSRDYDLIVIGSGPAGEKGAAQAAYFGKSVALVEKCQALGGAAANTGTLPSKTLRESALFLSGFRNRDLRGLQLEFKHAVNVQDLMARQKVITGGENQRIRDNLKHHQIALYQGAASFVDPHTIRVDGADGPIDLRGGVILIATGTHPRRPPGILFEDDRIFDSDEIVQFNEMPQTLLVVGGGVIGCEYACMFAALGVEVTVVEKRDRLVGFLDSEIVVALRAEMERLGIKVLTSDSVAEMNSDGPLRVRLASGLEFPSAVLVSAGRIGNTEGLGLDRAGVATDANGIIKVDERYRTSVPHIYAAGDIIGAPSLASTSMEQARVAMVDAFELKYKRAVAPILPYGIYTIPECSMAGDTEEQLQAQGIAYVAGRATYASNARGRIIGDDHGFLKLLYRADDMKLLGVHVIGEQATELVHIGLTALIVGADADLFIRACYNYPTLADLYKYATYDALGQQAKRVREANA